MEYQANQFAGLVLVPRKQLEDNFKHIVKYLKTEGHDPDNFYDLFEDYLYKKLVRVFGVSRQVLERRVRYEGLSI